MLKTVVVFALLGAAAGGPPVRPWVFDAVTRVGGHRAIDCGKSPSQLSQRCAEDIAFMCEHYAVGAEWAVRMYDAMTKDSDGLLEGHLVHLGNFDECVRVRGVARSNVSSFDGQHCIVGVRPKPETRGENNRTSVWDALADGRWLEVAWCVPSSCGPEDVLQLLQAMAGAALEARAPSQKCSTGTSPPLRPADIAAICVLSLMALLLVISTTYDALTRNSERLRPQGLLAFSALSNGRRLLAARRSKDLLGCLHGLRFLSASWVLLANCALLFGAAPTDNAFYLNEYVRQFLRMGIVNGDLAADTFFLLSGLLVSYLFLKDAETRGRFSILRFYAHRYLRLTPPAAAMVLLTASLLSRSGSGPLWTSRLQPLQENCERGWWRTLLYVSNYWPDSDRCLEHSWFLAADAQLYLLSPLLLLPLRRCLRLGRLWVGLVLAAAWATPFALAYAQSLDPAAVRAQDWAGEQYRRYHYLPAYTRSAPWLVGVLLGSGLRQARRNKPRLGQNVLIAGWSQATVAMLLTIYAQYPFQQPDHDYDRVGSAFYLSLFRLGWSLGVAWVIFACDQGYGGFVNAFLSWDAFQPLGRLSYCLYLTHVAVIHVMAGSVRSAAHLSDLYHISQFFATFMMSIAWAIPLAFLFELPVVPLEKALLRNVTRKCDFSTRLNLSANTSARVLGLKCSRQTTETDAAEPTDAEAAKPTEQRPEGKAEENGTTSLAPEEAVELGALPADHAETPVVTSVVNGPGGESNAIKIDSVERAEESELTGQNHAHHSVEQDVVKTDAESEQRNSEEETRAETASEEVTVNPTEPVSDVKVGSESHVTTDDPKT